MRMCFFCFFSCNFSDKNSELTTIIFISHKKKKPLFLFNERDKSPARTRQQRSSRLLFCSAKLEESKPNLKIPNSRALVLSMLQAAK